MKTAVSHHRNQPPSFIPNYNSWLYKLQGEFHESKYLVLVIENAELRQLIIQLEFDYGRLLFKHDEVTRLKNLLCEVLRERL